MRKGLRIETLGSCGFLQHAPANLHVPRAQLRKGALKPHHYHYCCCCCCCYTFQRFTEAYISYDPGTTLFLSIDMIFIDFHQ